MRPARSVRSVVLSKVPRSVIMSNELDIKNYFEYAKSLTLKAGEVSQVVFFLLFGEILTEIIEYRY